MTTYDDPEPNFRSSRRSEGHNTSHSHSHSHHHRPPSSSSSHKAPSSSSNSNSGANCNNGLRSQDERLLAVQLQKELQDLRIQTKTALESSWAEVERLQQDGSVSRERVQELENQLKKLRQASEARQREEEEQAQLQAQIQNSSRRREMKNHHHHHAFDAVFGEKLSQRRAAEMHENERVLDALAQVPVDYASPRFNTNRGGGLARMKSCPTVMTGPGGRSARQRLGLHTGTTAGLSEEFMQHKLHHNLTNALAITHSVDFNGEDGGDEETDDVNDEPINRRLNLRRRMSCNGRVEGQSLFANTDTDLDPLAPAVTNTTSDARSVTQNSTTTNSNNGRDSAASSTSSPSNTPPPAPSNTTTTTTPRNIPTTTTTTTTTPSLPLNTYDSSNRAIIGGVSNTTPLRTTPDGIDVLPADMLELLATLEHDKRIMVEELETKLKGKEAAIATLERTTSVQSSTVEALRKELTQLQKEAMDEDSRMREEMEKLEQDHVVSREKAVALEREIAKLELVLEQRRTRETQLAEELALLEEQTRQEEEKAQEQIAELEEKLAKKRQACLQIEQENEMLRQSCNQEFIALKQDLMEFLPQNKSEELTEQLMQQFAALKEKEEVLAEELAARMQDRQEILAALEKVSQVGKRVDTVVAAVEDLIEQLDQTKEGDGGFGRRASMGPGIGGSGSGGGGGGGGGSAADFKHYEDDEEKDEHKMLLSPEYKLNDRDVAIGCLHKALLVPKQIKESLNLVEGELMNLLDSMEVHGKQNRGGGGAHGSSSSSQGGGKPGGSSSNDALERAEALQETAKGALKEVEAELMDLLASLEEPSCDVVDELEAELASKDAKLASLESATAKQERTIESLTAELAQLQVSSKEESQASLAVMDSLQREVNAIVEGIAEKDQMIATLSKVLDERESNKAALQKELTDIRGKLTTLDPACPRDQCHAVL